MKARVALFSLMFLFGVHASAAEPVDESCECKESTCGPCEIETGTTFYSAKCGADLSRVKSCKKATCEAVENQKQCLALMKSKPEPEAVATEAPPVQAARAPASVSKPEGKAGSVDEVTGSAKIIHAHGGTENAKRGVAVFAGDTAETGDGKLRIVLNDHSEMTLPRNSSVKIERVEVDGEKARNIVMNLLKGKVRNHVAKGFKDQNVFEVKTRTAVAGVRGTDFIAAYELNDDEWITAVKTLEGKVRLSGANQDPETGENRLVAEGTTAAFIVKAPPAGASEAQINEKIEKESSLTPLSYMNEDEMRLLHDATEFRPIEASKAAPDRVVASIDSDVVCSEPMGKFNQCSFTCEGNPKGEKKCRTDMPEVSCVRRLCRANGQWAEPKRMPSSQSDSCEALKPVIKECGSYW